MNRSVSSNYLSPCFVPIQIFVATVAFLLPSAEHSTVEADKKVHVGEEETWNGWELKALDHVGMVQLQRNVSTLSSVLLSISIVPVFAALIYNLLFLWDCTALFCYTSVTFFLNLDVGWVNWKRNFFLTLSVDGVTAAVPVGLVHGCSSQLAAGTHHYAYAGRSHIPQAPTAGLHLQGG